MHARANTGRYIEAVKRNGDTSTQVVRVERMEELVLDRAFDRERAGEQVAQTEA